MEHRARRSAGRAGLRVEPEAIAADNRLRYCPLHRGQRVGGNACCVGEARQIVARQRMAAAVLRVPVQNLRELLAGDCFPGILAVGHAVFAAQSQPA